MTKPPFSGLLSKPASERSCSSSNSILKNRRDSQDEQTSTEKQKIFMIKVSFIHPIGQFLDMKVFPDSHRMFNTMCLYNMAKR